MSFLSVQWILTTASVCWLLGLVVSAVLVYDFISLIFYNICYAWDYPWKKASNNLTRPKAVHQATSSNAVETGSKPAETSSKSLSRLPRPYTTVTDSARSHARVQYQYTSKLLRSKQSKQLNKSGNARNGGGGGARNGLAKLMNHHLTGHYDRNTLWLWCHRLRFLFLFVALIDVVFEVLTSKLGADGKVIIESSGLVFDWGCTYNGYLRMYTVGMSFFITSMFNWCKAALVFTNISVHFGYNKCLLFTIKYGFIYIMLVNPVLLIWGTFIVNFGTLQIGNSSNHEYACYIEYKDALFFMYALHDVLMSVLFGILFIRPLTMALERQKHIYSLFGLKTCHQHASSHKQVKSPAAMHTQYRPMSSHRPLTVSQADATAGSTHTKTPPRAFYKHSRPHSVNSDSGPRADEPWISREDLDHTNYAYDTNNSQNLKNTNNANNANDVNVVVCDPTRAPSTAASSDDAWSHRTVTAQTHSDQDISDSGDDGSPPNAPNAATAENAANMINNAIHVQNVPNMKNVDETVSVASAQDSIGKGEEIDLDEKACDINYKYDVKAYFNGAGSKQNGWERIGGNGVENGAVRYGQHCMYNYERGNVNKGESQILLLKRLRAAVWRNSVGGIGIVFVSVCFFVTFIVGTYFEESKILWKDGQIFLANIVKYKLIYTFMTMTYKDWPRMLFPVCYKCAK